MGNENEVNVNIEFIDNSFKVLYTGEGAGAVNALGYISDNIAMNDIIEQCRATFVEDNGDVNVFVNDVYVNDDDVIIIIKLFARTLVSFTSTTGGENAIYSAYANDENDANLPIYELSEEEKVKVDTNPYKYVSMIDQFFNGKYLFNLESQTDVVNYTIPWLFQFAKNYHITSLETQSDLLSDFNSTLAGENKKKEELLDMVNRVEEQSKHRLQTRNRLSFINKDQIERMLFKNDFIRRTLFYLCLIIFVAFLSQFGISKFMTNVLCFILFVTWAIHSFIMYNAFNTRHNLQFRMKVYSGDVANVARNNIKYKNTDRCPNDDDDKPKGKC